jgi:hypothetical protein
MSDTQPLTRQFPLAPAAETLLAITMGNNLLYMSSSPIFYWLYSTHVHHYIHMHNSIILFGL